MKDLHHLQPSVFVLPLLPRMQPAGKLPVLLELKFFLRVSYISLTLTLTLFLINFLPTEILDINTCRIVPDHLLCKISWFNDINRYKSLHVF